MGGAIHTGAWHGNNGFVMVDMTGSVNGVGGGALHKYRLDFKYGAAYHEASISMGLTLAARGTSASKPIAIGTNTLGSFAELFFVTDAIGAGSIINVTDMSITKDFPLEAFSPCVGGGLWVEPHPEDPEVVIAQYGSQSGSECLFQLNLKKLAITKTYSLPAGADDAHGIQFCKNFAGAST